MLAKSRGIETDDDRLDLALFLLGLRSRVSNRDVGAIVGLGANKRLSLDPEMLVVVEGLRDIAAGDRITGDELALKASISRLAGLCVIASCSSISSWYSSAITRCEDEMRRLVIAVSSLLNSVPSGPAAFRR